MGVTLERVQFKFASIIGELCSEPDILSQFAVWVDLRLAEYKLKGSISLDCSGDTPDPVWLKGILSALLAKRLAKKREQSKPLGHSFGSGSPSSDVNYSRMRSRQSLPSHTESLHADESVVSVKDEPFDDVVYPVGLHAHEISRSPRKRSAAESLRGEDDGEQADIMYAHSMPKQSRSDNQTNESLMSIIGGENRQENNATSHSGFEQITETIDLIVDSEERGNSSLDATDMPSSFPLLDTSNDNNFSSLTTVGTSGFAEIQNKPEINRRIRGDVSKLEHWLRSRGDTRRAQDIPPVELDVYLVDFLTTAKTRSGGDYDPESLTTLRGNIDRYLKIVSYGHSITTSPLFGLSQAALKQRTDELRAEFSLTLTELMAIKQRQLIDCSCPGSLLRAVYFVNSFFFGNYLKSRGDHCNLRWGDLEIRKDALGKELLVLTGNASRLSGFSSRFIRALGARIVDAAVDQMEDKICPVTIYKEFRRHRPQKSLLPDTKFYLCPITRPHNDNWFELTAMDSLTLGNEVKQLKHTLAQHILNVPNTSEDRATNLGESR